MKRIYNYVILSIFAFAAVACLDELNQGDNLSNLGNEVQFGLSLNDPLTKTIYGPIREDGRGYPVYWSDGDKILVASPQCVSDRNVAEYFVTPMTGQNYAQAITRTGDFGVQWGSEAKADFYSIYPSNDASRILLEEDGVVANLKISHEQNANYVLTPAKTVTNENNETITVPGFYTAADMSNVIMYSHSTANKGEVVELKYTPYSTILEFELQIGENVDQQNRPTGEYGSIKIVSLTLTAPDTALDGKNITLNGDFSLEFNGSDAPTISAIGNNSNSIKMAFSTYPILDKTNQTLNAKIAVIPLSVNKLVDWTISVDVLEGTDDTIKTYTKTLNIDSKLEPGMIHKIRLPLFRSKTEWKPNMDNWIPALNDYQNIYLTELSLPGAWYASAKTTDGYQNTSSISDLWNNGVRAFAVETKCVSSTIKIITTLPLATPSDVVVSGTADNASISTASGTNSLGTGSGDRIYKSDTKNITLKTVFESIIDCLIEQKNDKDQKPEFAVLVLSYADGGTTGMRPVDFGAWLELIYDSYNSLSDSYKEYVYTKSINQYTTVSDVLNKLIIKVNVDDNIAMEGHVLYDLRVYKDERSYAYEDNMPALFSYNPFLSQLDNADYTKPLFSKIYWMDWGDGTSYRNYTDELTTDFLWCFSSANRTQVNSGTNATIPTYAERQLALTAMMQHSKELTDTKKHNVWFYFNAGGTQTTSVSNETTSATDFATEMNPWLLDLIKLKANGGTDTRGIYGSAGAYVQSDPSPLGIVMFNQCTNNTYHGPEIISEIVNMNNKFKLLRAGQSADSASQIYASGMNLGDSAFGWD